MYHRMRKKNANEKELEKAVSGASQVFKALGGWCQELHCLVNHQYRLFLPLDSVKALD